MVAALPLGPSTQVAGAGCPGRGRGQLGGERPSQGSGSLLAALPAVDKQVALASTAPGMVASTRRPWLEGGRRCADEPPPASINQETGRPGVRRQPCEQAGVGAELRLGAQAGHRAACDSSHAWSARCSKGRALSVGRVCFSLLCRRSRQVRERVRVSGLPGGWLGATAGDATRL